MRQKSKTPEPDEFIKTNQIYTNPFLYTLTIYTLYSLLTITISLKNLSSPLCGKKVRSSLATFFITSLIFIYLSILIIHLHIKPDYKEIKYMECNLFYVFSLLMVLSGGVSIVVLIWGEIDCLYIFYFFRVFDCIDVFTFFNVITVYGAFNLSFVYLGFLTIYEVFKLCKVREDFDFKVFSFYSKSEDFCLEEFEN